MSVDHLGKNSADGTSLGQSATSKISFYGATPIVQPGSVVANGTDAATSQALANDLKAKLIALGLIA